MDGREAMPLSGSSPYYMQQRGISSSGSGAQTGLHGQAGIRPLSSSGYTIQSNISSTVSTYPVEPPATAISPHGVSVGMTGGMTSVEPVKRKRGRPRKYGPDGTMALALSPLSSTPPQSLVPLQKRGRGRPPGSGRKQQLASLGEWIAGSAGMGFTPHIITISVGEDIASKIMSFSQLGPRAICILSASGAVSTVTLRQPSTSGGTVTYEGRFEILCLSGSYLLSEDGGTRSRTGGLSVSLASPDGRVVGGGVAGLLIAASPVQVIVGSFTYGGRKTQSKQESSDQVRSEPPMAPNIGMSDKTGASSGMMHSQSPGVVSQSGWPGSRSMDIRNSHIDIDLTRG
ncbi:AT-hook motif nuclear-localized protein 11-like [Nymphaea colorata]|uniref:AT-hook motif nuclear-localized protein 11-like n=1 Tax=Nymphaea colorata TaxID=210225 RepID=UPI00129ED9F2|nr:AT-hook motif nuclear-localized protein 11-like [Nymphaea colorata]XP_031501955.1 AT-hook motif nuclear-localized protein 11-like [Nymphaea colorata]